MKFRKKPVVIEAMQWNGGEAEAQFIKGWTGGMFKRAEVAANVLVSSMRTFVPNEIQTRWGVQTLEGFMVAKPGDWIIRGVAGEFYPCDDEFFQATYEAVEDA